MAATRLSDSQKEQIVTRYRQGESAQALAQAFGCSPNTVSRAVKAALGPQELAARPRGRKRTAAETSPDPAAIQDVDVAARVAVPLEVEVEVEVAAEVGAAAATAEAEAQAADDAEESDEEGGAHLAIDDADDFGDDGVDDTEDEFDSEELDSQALQAVATSGADRHPVAAVQPLAAAALPARLYLLVDKTVELQAQPLAAFPELGSLPEGEAERQALMLFTNPREAKRQCGRSQRVIPVPDPRLLERTASYLVSQGITRLVLEGGALYSLPGA